MRLNWLPYTTLETDGYGRYGKRMLRALHQLGTDITPLPYQAVKEWDGWMLRILGIDFSHLTVQIMPPNMFLPVAGRVFGYTMTESTGLEDGWAEQINQVCERLIVPSPWLIDVFHSSGVKQRIPIEVVSGGIDAHEFPMQTRQRRNRPFTFLALGDRLGRKGEDVVWSAMYKAFTPKELNSDVRLVVKCRAVNHPSMDLTRNPKWLSLWREDVPNMADVYAQVDAMIFPTRGEGYGMPPREAAATGLPVVATRWSGTADDLDRWGIPLERFKLRPAMIPAGGLWAEPDIDEVVERMRWIYDHQDEADALGARASAWLQSNRTWTHAAQAMLDVLERVA